MAAARSRLLLLAYLAVVGECARVSDAQVCVQSAVNLPLADGWPKKPAPEAWVKVEVGGRALCKTAIIKDSVTPRWEHCCDVEGAHQHSWYWFSVFDSDYAGDEADYLGSAGIPANSPAGVYNLELTGGELSAKHGTATLTIEVPLAPPPPPPPRGDVKAVSVHKTAAQVLDEAEGEGDEAKKFICVMSAKGLPQADFFPRVGVFKYPDTWVKLTARDTKDGAFDEAEEDAVAMNKKIEAQIQEHLDMENKIDEVHASGAELECATPVVSNTKSPDWSYCCDVSSISRKYFLLEVFDEDSIYYVNDYLGAAVLSTDSAEGQYELELAGGYDQGTINVLLVTSKHAPVKNKGANCWDACGQQGGLCPDYCGTMGACCQADYEAPGCPRDGGDPFWHSCQAADLSTLHLVAEPHASRVGAAHLGASGSTATVALLASVLVALVIVAARRHRSARMLGVSTLDDSATML